MILPLVILPFLLALPVLLLKPGRAATSLVIVAVVAQGGLALATAILGMGSLAPPEVPALASLLLSETTALAVELLLCAYFLYASIRDRRVLPALLSLVQAGLAIFGHAILSDIEVARTWSIDGLGSLMIIVVGLVGGLIVLYALGYMRRYHAEHPATRDRRGPFMAVFLAFLGAMYGISLANDLRLLLMFWELTTWASFILIGYAGDAASKKSAQLALSLNLVGGIALAGGIIVLAQSTGIVELDRLAALGPIGPGLAALPVALIALAGLVKSAQFPFTPWLLGAMVAPTPVSALLHSSTMVKAGVYLILRLSANLAGSATGDLVAITGITTFLFGAFLAIPQRNAKRVLALSTVSNLGLIVACAGIGGSQLLWAAFFLTLFHAVAKALLFLGVGTASLGTGSLDIEDMGGLQVRMPRLALLMTVGIAGMFLAPFGMLVSKWVAIEAFVSSATPLSLLLVACLAWGSAATLFFWMKWLGTMLRDQDPASPRGLLERDTTASERRTETLLAIAALLAFLALPIVSTALAEPWLGSLGPSWAPGGGETLTIIVMTAMAVALPALLVGIGDRGRGRLSRPYLSGRTAGPDSGGGIVYKGTAAIPQGLGLRAPYLAGIFGEARLLPIAVGTGLLATIITIGTALL